MNYDTVIGLEVHIQLKTKTKLFCPCRSCFGEPPNTLTCPVCSGQPGALPVLNEEALYLALKAGLALECKIFGLTRFVRKNYFYPDLPKGYQISQLADPVAGPGHVEIRLPDGKAKRIGITRAHLEEDAGKTLHPEGRNESWVDLNRAGVPLLEIVSDPEMASPSEAHTFLKDLKKIMQYAGVSDCDMEIGSLRCDANISLKPAGSREMGVKVEIKNLNSFRNVEKALVHEEARQKKCLLQGKAVLQETRMWQEKGERTQLLRSKEEAHDYRYFPEPDLPPFAIAAPLVERLRQRLPELPHPRMDRLIKDYGLSEYEARVLTADREIADFFEACAGICRNFKETSRWIQSAVMKEMNERGLKIDRLGITPDQLAALIVMVEADRLSAQAAGRVLRRMIDEGGEPEQLLEEMGLGQISDPDQLGAIIDRVVESCAALVAEYRSGKEATLNALIGQVMRESGGSAHPRKVKELLIKKIKG